MLSVVSGSSLALPSNPTKHVLAQSSTPADMPECAGWQDRQCGLGEWDCSSRVVFSGIANGGYNHEVAAFTESLKVYGHLACDIQIQCVDDACTENAQQLEVMHRRHWFDESDCGSRPAEESETRCQIALGKFRGVIDLMKQDIAVFFFDFDVFLLQDPLKLSMPSWASLATMNDRLRPGRGRLNFGLFLARPDERMKSSFADMLSEYTDTHAWDQEIYENAAKRTLQTGTQSGLYIFPLDQHVNWMINVSKTEADARSGAGCNSELRKAFSSSPAALDVHMTCVEGDMQKEFIAKEYAGWKDPLRKANGSAILAPTVTAKLGYGTDLKLGNLNISMEHLGQVTRILADVGLATGRHVRAGFVPESGRVLSADRFADAGVELVETTYWSDSADSMNVTFLNASSYLSLESLVNAVAERDGHNEVVIVAPEGSVHFVVGGSSLTCGSLQWPMEADRACGECLHWCDGEHFANEILKRRGK